MVLLLYGHCTIHFDTMMKTANLLQSFLKIPKRSHLCALLLYASAAGWYRLDGKRYWRDQIYMDYRLFVHAARLEFFAQRGGLMSGSIFYFIAPIWKFGVSWISNDILLIISIYSFII
jgi:hypothetical protein